ncbi:hypothetical protein San01_31570 [Streptomyces angustmyceticus]|uniref:Uncharacterized protein n=1 Tax=Streptomyces angustmyceticus TaxID=285578 RepID=A0A5J4LGL2_9ACTN|nr:hypothetical protein San01_31570 [Streptomyces angustmyceticus]
MKAIHIGIADDARRTPGERSGGVTPAHERAAAFMPDPRHTLTPAARGGRHSDFIASVVARAPDSRAVAQELTPADPPGAHGICTTEEHPEPRNVPSQLSARTHPRTTMPQNSTRTRQREAGVTRHGALAPRHTTLPVKQCPLQHNLTRNPGKESRHA